MRNCLKPVCLDVSIHLFRLDICVDLVFISIHLALFVCLDLFVNVDLFVSKVDLSENLDVFFFNLISRDNLDVSMCRSWFMYMDLDTHLCIFICISASWHLFRNLSVSSLLDRHKYENDCAMWQESHALWNILHCVKPAANSLICPYDRYLITRNFQDSIYTLPEAIQPNSHLTSSCIVSWIIVTLIELEERIRGYLQIQKFSKLFHLCYIITFFLNFIYSKLYTL